MTIRLIDRVPRGISSPFSVDVSSAPLEPNPPPYMRERAGERMISLGLGGPALPTDDFIPRRNSETILGKPVLAIPADTPLVTVATAYTGVQHVPIPEACKWLPRLIQNGEPGMVGAGQDNDRHLLMYCYETGESWELLGAYYDIVTGTWGALSACSFDLMAGQASMAEGETSADASGLSMIPGMLYFKDAVQGLNHGLRCAMMLTAPAHVYPAVHHDGKTVGALPTGARLRLKSSLEVNARIAAQPMSMARNILLGLQKYGTIVTDKASVTLQPGEISTDAAYDLRWPRELVDVGHAFTLGDFDLLALGWRP